MDKAGILSSNPSFENRYLTDFSNVQEIVDALRVLNQRVVLTSGSWDMLHVGHMRYLQHAREQGDLLIVGMDSDEKIRARKGETRPIVSEMERAEMLVQLRVVDLVVLKPYGEEPRQLLKLVRPDTLVISETTGHEDGDIQEMEKHCGKLVVFQPQAETSTTARIRRLMLDGANGLAEDLVAVIDKHIRGGVA